MASRHVRAVQRRNADYDDETDYRIMQVIATDIGEDDGPAFPSYREIASRTGVHYNTVMAHVKQMVEDGKLIAERDGRRTQYRLPFEVERGAPGHKPDCDNHYDNHNQLSQFEERLSQFERQLSQLSSQFDALIVTMAQSETVTEVKGSIREEGKYISTHAGIADEVDNGLNHDTERQDMIAAIANVSKETLTPENKDRFEDTADGFIGAGITLGQVDGFAHWWQENGYYKGSPALKTIVQEIKNSIAGVDSRASPNGAGSQFLPKGHEIEPAMGTDW